ncbi:MAG: imidazole glycerol phosphate synthase subunit HisF [Desulfobacterales bacterium]|nr:imidazole glycerol phosphate synthase subunit HisF [Desulfobacterales bacterium]
MVRKRLIIVLTFNNGVLFRTRNFQPDYRYTLNFVDAWSVDEVILLDISRPGKGNREIFYNVVKKFARNCFVPLTVGGGVRNLDDFKLLLGVGADKVAVNTGFIENDRLVEEASKLYGSQCVVVSMDVKKNQNSGYDVYSHFGTKRIGSDAVSFSKHAVDKGAGEILVQSIDRDGMLEGYDNEIAALISKSVSVPILLCSGAGNWEHFVQGFSKGCASGVCTTNIYHFTESSINSAKKYIMKKNINIRI